MKSENAKGYSVKDIKEFYHIYLPWGRIPEQLSKKHTAKTYLDERLKELGLRK